MMHNLSVENKIRSFFVHKKSLKKRIALVLGACVLIFTALCIAVVGVNITANLSFEETFYNVSSIKVRNTIRVIQLSDLHNSRYGKDNRKLLERISELEPDVIIATGDMLDRRDKKHDVAYGLFEGLVDIAPTYFIYGNNEWSLDFDFKSEITELEAQPGQSASEHNLDALLNGRDSIGKELERIGVRVLMNESETIEIGGDVIDIYGVFTSNISSFWPYAEDSFAKYIDENQHHIKVFACHEPYVFETYKDGYWGDVMLCGHTHGGISDFPVVGALWEKTHGLFPEKLGEQHYVRGKYELNGGTLIVNKGLSNRGIVRINNKPELAIIDIGR